MNKKGADKIIAVYWFAILILVAGGIFLMVSSFYSHPYDVRELEVRALTNKVADCFSYQGKLNSGLVGGGKFNPDFNFLEECDLIINDEYYVNVGFFSVDENQVFGFEEGNKNYVPYCELQEKDKELRLPECLEKRVYALDDSENQYLIKILSIVNKVDQNVK